MMNIVKNSVVSIRYIMKKKDGVVLEDKMPGDPVSYLHGATGILQVLQEQLEGLKAGDKKTIYLPVSSGLTNEDFIFEVIVDDVRVALKEEILLGYPVALQAAICEAGCDCYTWQQ